jgi:AhpD family alkylhydroperoxidase
LDYRLDTALPIRQLTQILLRGESTLTPGERELIATIVSNGNECQFCTAAHTAAANQYLDDPDIAEMVEKAKAAGATDRDKGYLPSSDRYSTL